MREEIWKNIPGYYGLYQVSSLGRVKSLERYAKTRSDSFRLVRERILKQRISPNSYLVVRLFDGNKGMTFSIHQLVAISFLNHKRCGYKLVVNHKNNDRLDNNLENLEVITQRENTNQKHLKSSSKYVGVYWSKQHKKYRSVIYIKGKPKHLGLFVCEKEASIAYQKELELIKT